MPASRAGSVTSRVRPWPSIRATPRPRPTVCRTSGSAASMSASLGLTPLPPAPKEGAVTARSPAKDSATVSSSVALMDAPKTVNSVTTATPIISAVAVAAVRRGLRAALRLASVPGTPRSRASGAPSVRTARVAATGPSTTVPASAASAPAVVSATDGPSLAPTTAAGTPPASRTAPSASRSRPDRPLAAPSTAVSRRAASGAVRPARRAGSSAEPAATAVPTASGSRTAAALITMPPVGSEKPSAENSALRPVATPMPPSRPPSEASRPTASASARVAPRTWPRAAPSALSSAFSLVRWATTMAKVLWMVNVATSSAMPAKTSSRVVNMVRNRPETCAVLSAVAAAPVTASTPPGSCGASSRTSSACEVPALARTWTEPACPAPLGVRWRSASSRVSAVKVLGPMPSALSPKVAMPTTVIRTGSGVRSTVVSPMCRPPLFAAPRLTTASPGAAGARPSASLYGLSCGSVSQFPASVGGPCPPTGLPSLPTSWPAPTTDASAAATPGTVRSRAARSASTGARTPPGVPGESSTSALRTTASVPALASANSVSKLARSVSPSTIVPARKLTPSRIDRNVPARRRRWARSERRLIRRVALAAAVLPAVLSEVPVEALGAVPTEVMTAPARTPSSGPAPGRRWAAPSGRPAGRRRGRPPRRRTRRRSGRG